MKFFMVAALIVSDFFLLTCRGDSQPWLHIRIIEHLFKNTSAQVPLKKSDFIIIK